jgi:hypothetical protein
MKTGVIIFKKNLILIFLPLFMICVLQSCKKDNETNVSPVYNLDSLNVSDYLFNIPIRGDTIFFDYRHTIDYRVALENRRIDSVYVTIDDRWHVNADTSTLQTLYTLYRPEGDYKIQYRIVTLNLLNNRIEYFLTKPLNLKIKRNLAKDFFTTSVVDGRLQITWPDFDKEFTDSFIIERLMGDDPNYGWLFKNTIETESNQLIDNGYVGEEVGYRIYSKNRDGKLHRTWFFTKDREDPEYLISHTPEIGYYFQFESCQYHNNFGKYILIVDVTTPLLNSENIKDTFCIDPYGHFACRAEYSLLILPKELPADFGDRHRWIYHHYYLDSYGYQTFKFDRLTKISENKIAYTHDQKIYLRDLTLDINIDSIYSSDADYLEIRSTPSGEYIYSRDKNPDEQSVLFWNTNLSSTIPAYAFTSGSLFPIVSDNLIGIMANSESPFLASLYDITNDEKIFETPYKQSASISPGISNNGMYFLIGSSSSNNPKNYYCSYINNTFTTIWENIQPTYFKFYSFDPVSNQACYLWDNNGTFFIKNIADFSTIHTFDLPVTKIKGIDYNSRKILCFKHTGNYLDLLLVYNLDTGELLHELSIYYHDVLSYDDVSIVGNTIYSTKGVKYQL